MQVEVVTKSKSLQGVTDLTLAAVIKPGLIPALDSRTYASRVRLLLSTLNAGRSSTREYVPIRPLSDTVERIHAIHSFRLAILEAEQKVLLAVTFDGGWEPYMRLIWRDLGPLLDVIFCNCEGYVTAWDHTYEQYIDWVRSAQVKTEFFYNAGPHSVDDLQYLRQVERLSRESPGSPSTDVAATAMVSEDPEERALATALANLPEAVRQGVTGLTGLYRLVDMYPPNSPDADTLLRAAHELLLELRKLDTRTLFPASNPLRTRFRAQLAWFEQPGPAAPGPAEPTIPGLNDLQGGIITPYAATHGALLLFAFESAAAASDLLTAARLRISIENGPPPADGIHCNIAFTYEGLRLLGLTDQELEPFAQEFKEGMEARFSTLGDVQSNHPRNWRLPERNWVDRPEESASVGQVQLSMVHALVQLTTAAPDSANDHAIVGNPSHPLHARIGTLVAGLSGVRLLSVQAMKRNIVASLGLPRDHFGFVDGISQPKPSQGPGGPQWSNEIGWGDLLLGHARSGGDSPTADAWRMNGTYLVVRKLRQDVGAFNDFLTRASQATLLPVETIKAKMMGRTSDGDALADPGRVRSNDFDYRGDQQGALCPFQAHIRRANPRLTGKRRTPRIMRRGMSFGPRFDKDRPTDDERGVMFMAYNANIAEQFEVLQRWIAGGNSTDVYSGQTDPLMGVARVGDPRTFRFQHNGVVHRVDLDRPQAQPFVRVDWGAYFFVPSMTALAALRERAAEGRRASVPWKARSGKQPSAEFLINGLMAQVKDADSDPDGGSARRAKVAQGWKALLEDISARSSFTSAAVWEAVRKGHLGVLDTDTDYGVLVCGREQVRQVFLDPAGNYSVSGYRDRMRDSFGEIFLGLDAGSDYDQQSTAITQALMAVSESEAFLMAHGITLALLQSAIAQARAASVGLGSPIWELTLDMKEVSDAVLGKLCERWFGVPEGTQTLVGGGWSWDWQPADPPRCPGHFTAPSRYLFQPLPGPAARDYGENHGRVLRTAFEKLVADHRALETTPQGPLARVLFDAFPNNAVGNNLLARTFIGVLMGFLPTVDGNLRATLYEWINDRSLWDYQADLAAPQTPDEALARSREVIRPALIRTMQLRPVPELVWRTAARDHTIGGTRVKAGRRVVVAIVSATQEALDAGTDDAFPVFGGDRRANPRPLHACPAYSMAMGVLQGIIVGLLARPILPTPLPLTLRWTGKTS